MSLVVIAWSYVVLMVALVEALRPGGSLFGAIVTLLLYGALPLAVLIYISGGRARRRAARAAEAPAGPAPASSDSVDPGSRGQAAAQPVATEREEP